MNTHASPRNGKAKGHRGPIEDLAMHALSAWDGPHGGVELGASSPAHGPDQGASAGPPNFGKVQVHLGNGRDEMMGAFECPMMPDEGPVHSDSNSLNLARSEGGARNQFANFPAIGGWMICRCAFWRGSKSINSAPHQLQPKFCTVTSVISCMLGGIMAQCTTSPHPSDIAICVVQVIDMYFFTPPLCGCVGRFCAITMCCACNSDISAITLPHATS